ncbi:MAG: hypothetical protein JWM59_4488 [Verrucomicrobiales bacterium]|nr:hypothetical protein [Verrucomicrobiales bacterium]
MKPPPAAFPPPDPLVDEGLEKRFHQTAPAPVPADLMKRLLQARPPPSESGASSNRKAAAPAPHPAFLSHPRFYSRQALTAAALVVCGWAGWRATAPDTAPRPASGPKADNHPQPPPPPPENTFPGMEFLPSLESRQHLLQVKELGVIRDSQQRPVRLMSATWLDENTYGHSNGDPALHESRLRHEIVPVLLPTY